MTFEEAMHDSCRELGLDGHIKTIEHKKDCYTYAEEIACNFKDKPFQVKNSYMFLDGVDFCFYQDGEDVNFAISGYIARNDKLEIVKAINKALSLCTLCEQKLKKMESD